MKKFLIIAFLLIAVAVFWESGLAGHLTIEGLKNSLDSLLAWRDSSPIAAAAAFLGLYIVIAALSLPGAAILTLAAGALFGLFWGTVLASMASSIGALLAFLAARTLLRNTVQKRFAARLKPINEGMAREGAFYLFTLRLVPVFPFFLVNLLMGLTPIRAGVFYLASQVGMLAGTIVYVNAGTQLAQLSGLSDILSPALMASFALLGLFPWVAKAGVSWWRRRQLYARWRRPKRADYNIVVIGAGAGGLVTSYIGAAVKARVALVEAGTMGGDCLNTGCVPSKALIKSARLAHQMRHADQYGLEPVDPAFSFRKIMERVQTVIKTIAPHDSVERYTELGVDVIQGYAKIIDPWTVEVTNANTTVTRLTTRSIVIATGSRPFVPPLPGLAETGYLTSDTLWSALAEMDTPPQRLTVLGGGPIGVELAQALARLGSSVTLVELAPRLLVREDEDVSAHVHGALVADGITVLTNHRALRCDLVDGVKYLVVECAGQSSRIAFDSLLCAVGRAPRLAGYGLEEMGIPTDKTVLTNQYLETLYPNIYAVGDVAGPYQFTHTAAHQAWYAAVNALFGNLRRFKADYRVIPWTTFTDPEVARVGLNEQEAIEKGVAFEVTRYDIADLDRAIAESAAHGFVKILTVPGKDVILGATIVGSHAGDLLAEFVLAMKWRLGLNKILSTIHAYPTFSEAGKYAAGEWKRAHVSPRILGWLGRYHTWRRG